MSHLSVTHESGSGCSPREQLAKESNDIPSRDAGLPSFRFAFEGRECSTSGRKRERRVGGKGIGVWLAKGGKGETQWEKKQLSFIGPSGEGERRGRIHKGSVRQMRSTGNFKSTHQLSCGQTERTINNTWAGQPERVASESACEVMASPRGHEIQSRLRIHPAHISPKMGIA